jgi:starch-binding outer membrane protein, SusD/RagB family
MKFKKIIAFTALIALLTGCIGDLNVKPIDPNVKTSQSSYTTPQSYKQGLAKLYSAFSLSGQQGPSGNADISGIDEGFGLYLRALWYVQEFTTDEAVWSYPNDANGTIFNLHYMNWVPTDLIPASLFARIVNTVALCNEYVRVTNGSQDAEIKKYNAEARFLRALAYYHGLDVFGKMPFITETDLPGAFLPKQISRADLFAYIEKELLATQNEMGAAKFEYGRADKAANSMLLAKLYLNSEIYLGAGQKKYTEAITELNKVIAGPYTLSPKYLTNFLADNEKSPEIIFPFAYDAVSSQAFSMVQVMIQGNSGYGGWAGLRTTKQFVGKFNLSEPRALFATENFPSTSSQKLEMNSVAATGDGYGLFKFRNIKSDGTSGKTNSDNMVDTDFPYFRLPDAHLMYAEAVLRGGTGGDITTALGYVNAIRQRSGDTNTAGPITSGQLTLDFILDERARELYWEGHRRTDLIRFGKFTSSDYLWAWKGNVKDGAGVANYRNVFPIPSTDIGSNPNLKQNDGY